MKEQNWSSAKVHTVDIEICRGAPAESGKLLWIDDQHLSEHVLRDFRYLIDFSGELDWVLLYVPNQIDHVACNKGRLSKQHFIKHLVYRK